MKVHEKYEIQSNNQQNNCNTEQSKYQNQRVNTSCNQKKNESRVGKTIRGSNIEPKEIIEYIATAMETLRNLETCYKQQLDIELIHSDQ